MSGLDVASKTIRVRNYQQKTVETAFDIIGAMGHTSPTKVTPKDIMKRVQATGRIATFAELYPRPAVGSLLAGTGPEELQTVWNQVLSVSNYSSAVSTLVKDADQHLRQTVSYA